MALNGIPISEDQCIGDSLETINASFLQLDAKTSIPPGTIIMIANSSTAPSGFLLCDGTRVFASVYPDLYNSLTQGGTNTSFGTTQTIGDDLSFVLPNLSAGDILPTGSRLFGAVGVFIKT